MHASRFLPLLACLACSAIPRTVLAQLAPVVPPQQSQGMMTGTGVGVQIDHRQPTIGVPSQRMRIRTPGTTTGRIEPWSETVFGAAADLHPDYSSQALFAHWTLFNSANGSSPWNPADPFHNPVLGDMSTGSDLTPRVVPVSGLGVMDMNGGANVSWYSLSFTVGAGTTGVPGSVFGQVADASGHVYSYTAQGSTNIRPELVDTLRFEYTRGQMGLDVTSELDSEITGLDWGMGVISTNAGGAAGTFQLQNESFYFTLDRDWWVTFGSVAGAGGTRVNNTVQVPGELPFELDPSVVYRMDWLDDRWSVPVEAFGQMALYGTTYAVGESSGPAIDGLSVDRPDPGQSDWRVVFSLDSESSFGATPPPSEILVSQGFVSGAGTVQALPLAVEAAGGNPTATIEDKIGIGPDEVEGLCGRDPKEIRLLDPYVATPLPEVGSTGQTPIGLSLQRFDVVDPGGQATPSILWEVHGIEIGKFDLRLVTFELQTLPNNPMAPMTLPIVFQPKVDPNPSYFWIEDGAETFSLLTGMTPLPGQDLFVRAVVVGFEKGSFDTPYFLSSWVSGLSM